MYMGSWGIKKKSFVSTVLRKQRKGLCTFWLLPAIFRSGTLFRQVGTWWSWTVVKTSSRLRHFG